MKVAITLSYYYREHCLIINTDISLEEIVLTIVGSAGMLQCCAGVCLDFVISAST